MEQILLYISHFFKSSHRRGFGIHPPFAYKFVSEAVFGKNVVSTGGIEKLRHELVLSGKMLEIIDFGAGPRLGSSTSDPSQGNYTLNDKRKNIRNLRDVVRQTSVSARKGSLLGRIAAWTGLPLILELGTGTGFSSLYMGSFAREARILSCEGSQQLADIARQNLRSLDLKNVEVVCDSFSNWLPRVLDDHPGEKLVLVDGDHRGERFLDYVEWVRSATSGRLLIVADDIYWSYDMNRAWKKLTSGAEESLCFELFNLGIVFIGYPVQGGLYKLRF